MGLKSSFQSDLNKEQQLSVLLDNYYHSHLKHYAFERVSSLQQQLRGVDVNFIHKKTKKIYTVDEKAQLDYLNEDLPTFAFEISYIKDGALKPGWLFDNSKTTDFYALATGIFVDDSMGFLFCKITLVNRQKLIDFLAGLNITKAHLEESHTASQLRHGKIAVESLNERREGYLYHSKKNKAEKPLNLVLKLDWLIENRLAKRLV